MEKLIAYVGLDVHKETISVAFAQGGDRGDACYIGKIANNAGALSKLARKLSQEGRQLRFCYEAGPCGYAIHRHLTCAWRIPNWTGNFGQMRTRTHYNKPCLSG